MGANIKDKVSVGLTALISRLNMIRVLWYMFVLGSLFSLVASAGGYQYSAAYNALWGLCSVYNTVVGVIFILALVLIVLGGALFAGSNMLPAQTKGQIQGYGMSMVIGGIIGIVIFFIAPFILGVLGASSTQLTTCNGWSAYNVGGPTSPPGT
jgi:hypothetical protein